MIVQYISNQYYIYQSLINIIYTNHLITSVYSISKSFNILISKNRQPRAVSQTSKHSIDIEEQDSYLESPATQSSVPKSASKMIGWMLSKQVRGTYIYIGGGGVSLSVLSLSDFAFF